MFPEDLLTEYDEFLKSLGFMCKEVNPENDRHGRLRIYNHPEMIAYDGKPYKVLLFIDPEYYKGTGITTKIYYPTQKLIDLFSSFFSKTYVPNISELEITFDFYTNQKKQLARLLKYYMVMKHNRFEPAEYEATNYQTTKIVSKGMRDYPKDTIVGDPVRLEVIAKRPFIKKYNIELENLNKILQRIDFSELFSFKSFKFEKYLNSQRLKLNRLHRRIMRQGNKLKRKMWTTEMRYELQKLTINRDIEIFLPDNINGNPRRIAHIKSELSKRDKQYHRFLTKELEVEKAFFEGMNYRSFL